MPSRVLAEIRLDDRYTLVLEVDDTDPRRPVRQSARGPAGDDAATIEDPGFTSALLAAMGVQGAVERSTMLRGEQTNTSIVAALADGRELVVKLFRTVQHGDNPDVELQRVLSDAGADFVPRFAGALESGWPDADGVPGRGHLAIAQEFVRGATDGWVLATRAAAADEDFAEPARALGSVTARMHAVLAERLPTELATAPSIGAQAALWRTRFAEAAAAVPAIAAARPAIEEAYLAAVAVPWPPLQRIHGDLHLGQLLYREGRWVVLDFEGEPLRALAERTAPEPALRDVAGMLRSFDYAAAGDAGHAAAWGAAARAAFLDGYRDAAGADSLAPAELLRAFELDKAVYEALYEARHRPSWVGIPVAAIARLTADG
ncbi:phosphotransferase [Pseudolysinimonas sp.]|uniref:phosphotransferase n=1 Tax=Pseudolysinimonas sp. TaxID=2680009 RepID=UPI003F7E3F7D